MTAAHVPWGVALRPIGQWLWRLLPASILRRFYSLKDFEKDVLLSLDQNELPWVQQPTKFRPGFLGFRFLVKNASPYLDAHIASVSLQLTSSDAHRTQGGLFGDIADWSRRELKRGTVIGCNLQMSLSERQVEIVNEQWAKLSGSFVARLDSAIGEVAAHYQFDVLTLARRR